ncbi:hypothetical protein FBY06_11573 [Pseudomonas sp. SJZ085]|nr:hypothetical protein FBX99_11573 [Pseudomonas sp. SJZ074]TWC36120.1 hypothetical protein FBY06_11573 [Pseudomonas sp. SJZ085]
MTTTQRSRRRAIRLASAITGALFLITIFLGPAIAGLITQ